MIGTRVVAISSHSWGQSSAVQIMGLLKSGWNLPWKFCQIIARTIWDNGCQEFVDCDERVVAKCSPAVEKSVNIVIEKQFTDCSNLSVSVMEKEETKDAKAEEAEGKGQLQEQQEGFVLCFC